MPGGSGKRLMLVEDPDGQRHARALFSLAEGPVLIESRPDCRHEIAVEAVEPGVVRIIGGAGLAGDIVAVQHTRCHSRAASNDVRHHIGE